MRNPEEFKPLRDTEPVVIDLKNKDLYRTSFEIEKNQILSKAIDKRQRDLMESILEYDFKLYMDKRNE